MNNKIKNRVFRFACEDPMVVLMLIFLFEFFAAQFDLSRLDFLTQLANWLSGYIPLLGNWPNDNRGQEIKNYIVLLLFLIPVSILLIYLWLDNQNIKTLGRIMILPGDPNKSLSATMLSLFLVTVLALGSGLFVFTYGNHDYLNSGNALRQSIGKYNLVIGSNLGMWFVLAVWHFGIVLSTPFACFIFSLKKWLNFTGVLKHE